MPTTRLIDDPGFGVEFLRNALRDFDPDDESLRILAAAGQRRSRLKRREGVRLAGGKGGSVTHSRQFAIALGSIGGAALGFAGGVMYLSGVVERSVQSAIFADNATAHTVSSASQTPEWLSMLAVMSALVGIGCCAGAWTALDRWLSPRASPETAPPRGTAAPAH